MLKQQMIQCQRLGKRLKAFPELSHHSDPVGAMASGYTVKPLADPEDPSQLLLQGKKSLCHLTGAAEQHRTLHGHSLKSGRGRYLSLCLP